MDSELINIPMTRKEFLTLPMDLRRKILKRQVDNLKPPKIGTLCKKCAVYKDCEMRNAVQYCGRFKKSKSVAVKKELECKL
jgi:hypothetical protein